MLLLFRVPAANRWKELSSKGQVRAEMLGDPNSRSMNEASRMGAGAWNGRALSGELCVRSHRKPGQSRWTVQKLKVMAGSPPAPPTQKNSTQTGRWAFQPELCVRWGVTSIPYNAAQPQTAGSPAFHPITSSPDLAMELRSKSSWICGFWNSKHAFLKKMLWKVVRFPPPPISSTKDPTANDAAERQPGGRPLRPVACFFSGSSWAAK